MDNQCVLTVDTMGGTDTSSWYDLYKALMAVNVVCIHREPALSGFATRIGEFCYSMDGRSKECDGGEMGMGKSMRRYGC